MSVEKTNAARLLDKAKVQYELRAYEVDETDLSAVRVALQLNEPVAEIFKTLVLKGDKTSYFVCIVPAGSELNLKSAAKISGNKNCEMIPMKDLLTITGYIRGACSPFAMKKLFPTYIHESCNDFAKIYVSAGKRGVQLYISPADILMQTKATLGNIIE
jgi:Cys-tRNA(Pro)/Cys-tRNA(Cys) deacylase